MHPSTLISFRVNENLTAANERFELPIPFWVTSTDQLSDLKVQLHVDAIEPAIVLPADGLQTPHFIKGKPPVKRDRSRLCAADHSNYGFEPVSC